jgi:hypothetical protein
MRPFMRYVIARYVEYQREMAYRYFVTDALYEDSDRMRIVPSMRYYERINPREIDKRSGDEIAEDVIRNAGLVKR